MDGSSAYRRIFSSPNPPSNVSEQQQQSPKNEPLYSSAGGGEMRYDGGGSAILRSIANFLREEHDRPNHSSTVMVGPDYHSRPPAWLEDKKTAIDGTPLTDIDLSRYPSHWSNKYKKELDVAEAVQEVKKQRRFEADHDIIGSVAKVRRWLGWSVPLDEDYAKRSIEGRHQLEEEARRIAAGEADAAKHSTTADTPAPSAALEAEQLQLRRVGTLPRVSIDGISNGGAEVRPKDDGGRQGVSSFLTAPWKAMRESVETGKPLATVVNSYHPRVDYYGIEPFLDSAPSLIWLSAKSGIFIGLVHGTLKAIQAMNVDVQFLRASGVGVLSILNMSVFASVVKWCGNTTLFAMAFCVGDRLMTAIKYRLLPAHDAQWRSTSNYVMGLACSGAMIGVLPWWVLSDGRLAARMAASGFAVGAALGLMVGLSMQRMVALNTARLDATSRQLRRYEALMQRERIWAEEEKAKYASAAYVWW